MAATTRTRVAFVTGAAQGIGEAIALRLAHDGLDVAVLDIKGKEGLLQDVTAQILGLGRRSLWQTGDVSNEDEVRSAVQQVADTLGGIDVVRVASTQANSLSTDHGSVGCRQCRL